MTKTKNFIHTSLTYKYFGKKILKNKKTRDILITLEELLVIKKNIKKLFNTDNPREIKNLIGQTINNKIITERDFKYSNLIDQTYKKIYNKFINLFGDNNTHVS
ncbi:MAG TPA: hypothetical protein V7792_01230 [Candidatus Azoamicus sp. OHIO2]